MKKLLFIIGLLILTSCNSGLSEDAKKFEAYTYAENFVKMKIKSPSTARFPSTLEKSKHIVKIKEGKYKVASWVDSQNGFGATVRSGFSCTIVIANGKVTTDDFTIY